MNTSLLFLTLLLAPALSVDPFQWFKDNHTYNKKNRAFDCTTEMNLKQSALTYCRPCSSVILGSKTDITPLNNVINICRGEGTSQGDNLYRSNVNFRTVKCILDRGTAPPHCVYRSQYQTGRITVGCSRGNPVHFQSCERQ